MNQFALSSVLGLVAASSVASCAGARGDVQKIDPSAQSASATGGTRVSDDQVPINQRFRTLDDYLLWLQQTAGPVDRPWYKQVGPGIYELQTAGNLHLDVPSNEKRTFTREELEKKFGFSR